MKMVFKTSLVFLMILVSCYSRSFSQNTVPAHYSNYTTSCRIIDSISGVEYYTLAEGKTSDTEDYIFFSFNSIARLKDVKLEVKRSNGSWKKINKPEYQDTKLDGSHFYTDTYLRVVRLPEKSEFRIKAEYILDDIFLLPQLMLATPYNLDTISVRMEFPDDYPFQYRLQHVNEENIFTIDTLTESGVSRFEIKAKPEKIEPDYSFFSPTLSKISRIPVVACLIVPPSYSGSEHQYLNDWYLGQLNTLPELSDESIAEFKSITDGVISSDSIISLISRELKQRIKYLDVMIGIGSLRPSDPNEVLYRLQGDCKDMSFLLCSALKSYGIDARVAVASTWNNNMDLDFPVISAGDHAVCAIRSEDEWRIIDLTEKYINIEYPGRGIQGRHLYITGEEGGVIYKVEPVEADTNRLEWKLDLTEFEQKFIGRFSLSLKGLAMSDLREIRAASPVGSQEYLKDYLQIFSDKIQFDSLEVFDEYNSVRIEGSAETLSQAMVRTGESTLLFRNYIPYPHPFDRFIIDDLHFNSHILSQDLHLRIRLNSGGFNSEQPAFDYEDSFSKFSSWFTAENDLVETGYKFRLDQMRFSGESVKSYNQMNNTLKSYFDNVFILK